MTDLGKLLACAAGSIVVHAAVARALELLPPQAPPHVARPVEVRIVEKEPPPEPPPEPPRPEPPPPTPTPTRPAPARPSAPRVAPNPTPPTPPPPPDHAPANTSDEPVFGISMESTSQGGSGPAMTVGGGGGGGARAAGGGSAAPVVGPAQPSSEPVPEYAVTTPPLPQGRCTGKYTDEARTAGLEGTVVLDLVVGEDGSVRDVRVTEKLGHGLDQAAVAALRACHFTPGEKDGHRVAVKVRGFKIRFVLSDAP